MQQRQFCSAASQSAAYSEPDYVEYTNGSGAGNSAVYDAKADESYEAEYAAAETAEGGSYTAETPAPDPSLLQEKLVYNGDLLIETLKYEESAAQLKELISSYNGIIEWQDEYDGNYNWYTGESSGTRTMTMTVRIPTEHFDAFMNAGDGVGKVISRSTGVTNISRQYYDTSVQIEALEKQQTRLLEMMDKAETIQDMIAVEQRLTDVQTQLNSLKTHRQSMDTDVMYSTVTVRLNEVKEYVHDNESFFERAGNAFISGWKNFPGRHVYNSSLLTAIYSDHRHHRLCDRQKESVPSAEVQRLQKEE